MEIMFSKCMTSDLPARVPQQLRLQLFCCEGISPVPVFKFLLWCYQCHEAQDVAVGARGQAMRAIDILHAGDA